MHIQKIDSINGSIKLVIGKDEVTKEEITCLAVSDSAVTVCIDKDFVISGLTKIGHLLSTGMHVDDNPVIEYKNNEFNMSEDLIIKNFNFLSYAAVA
ncbi:MAG: hypothetical protein N2749_05430 [Clostridia bacterium]|nr:hypothetical protein [Clostridia bacterium]